MTKKNDDENDNDVSYDDWLICLLSSRPSSNADEPRLQLEYNFEEHFQHLPPTLYNRYLKSHRFLTKGKRLAPSPLSSLRSNRCLPIDHSTSYARQRESIRPHAPSSLSSHHYVRPEAIDRFQLPTSLPSLKRSSSPSSLLPSVTGTVSRPVSLLSFEILSKNAFDSGPASQITLNQSRRKSVEPSEQESIKLVKDSESNALRSTTRAPVRWSQEQTELVRTLGECIQVMYEQLQQMANAPDETEKADSKQSEPKLRNQVKKLHDIANQLSKSERLANSCSSASKHLEPGANNTNIEPSDEGNQTKNRTIRLPNTNQSASKQERLLDQSKAVELALLDESIALEIEPQSIDYRATNAMQKLVLEDLISSPETILIKPEVVNQQVNQPTVTIESRKVTNRIKKRVKSNRNRRNRKNLIEARHLVDLLVYNQLVDQLQQFYGYSSNEQLDLWPMSDKDHTFDRESFEQVANSNKCLLTELKNKLTGKLNIIHYKIYQKVQRKMNQKSSPIDSSLTGSLAEESDLSTTDVDQTGSDQFVITRRLNKRIKCQSKYTLLMELMDDASFRQFLMDKVKYFLRKIRSDRLRKLAAKQTERQIANASSEKTKMDENNNEIMQNSCNNSFSDGIDCKDFFAIYKCSDSMDVRRDGDTKPLHRSDSGCTIDSGFSSMPTSPTVSSFDRRRPFESLIADQPHWQSGWNSRSELSQSAEVECGRAEKAKSAQDGHLRFYCAVFTAVVVLVALTSLHESSSSSPTSGSRHLPSTLNSRRPGHMSCADWILFEAETLFNWPPK